ncbi:MAG: 4-(cytidine 5'-diphospho)-2-C-methyl-D-erythritol kinase, partial [Acetobacteraceae bacterium]|nr:4-(cytidine 5'-diphospho)-2-C-methyl-D-erythritol kinase [Acetobacteraceae bacterium]
AIEAQPGCLIARMSGSGATCFGLFPDRSSAKQAAKALAGRGWWCQAGSLTCGAA